MFKTITYLSSFCLFLIMASFQFSLVLTLTCRFSNWFHSGFAFFSMIWVHSWRCTSRTHQCLFCFATRYIHMWLQRLCLFWEPFCLQSEPPKKDPPGSSCSPLLQTCLLSTAQRHRPLPEDTGGILDQDLFRLVGTACLQSGVSRRLPAACRSGEWSYSGECPRLCTPSATGWPSEESLQQAAADCSQCRPGHRWSPSSPPAKHRRDKRPVRGSGLSVARLPNLHEEEEEKRTKENIEEVSGVWHSPLARQSYRRLVPGPHHKQADFEVAFGPGAGVIWVVEQEPLPNDRVGCKQDRQTHITCTDH